MEVAQFAHLSHWFDDRVRDARLIFRTEEDETFSRAGTLSSDYSSGDARIYVGTSGDKLTYVLAAKNLSCSKVLSPLEVTLTTVTNDPLSCRPQESDSKSTSEDASDAILANANAPLGAWKDFSLCGGGRFALSANAPPMR
jgi:hypothetical protein